MTESSTLSRVVWNMLGTKEETSLVYKRRQLEDFYCMTFPFGDYYSPKPAHPMLDLKHMLKHYRGNEGEFLTTFDEVNYANIFSLIERTAKEEESLIVQAKSHMRAWTLLWQLLISKTAKFKGSHCLKFSPLMYDIARSNSKEDWKKGTRGSTLYPLMQLTLTVPPQCLHLLPEDYRTFRERKDIHDLFGEVGNKKGMRPQCDIDVVVESLRKTGLANTRTVEENNVGMLFYPSSDGLIPDSLIVVLKSFPPALKIQLFDLSSALHAMII